MSQKNSNTTSDFLDFDATLNKSFRLLKTDKKKYKIAFLCIVGVNLGLRISDLLSLKHRDLTNDTLIIIEKKTSKRRELKLNQSIKDAYAIYRDHLGLVSGDDYLFMSQKKTTFSNRQVNRLLQSVYGTASKNISTHSLRKTFGRRVWENDQCSERSLIMLSKIFNHTSVATTRIYLGIQQEELDNIYLTL